MDRRTEEKNLREAEAGEPHPQPVGDAAGAIVGTAAGASMGILAGPLGAMVGAAAGALGGWWAGHHVAEALQNYDEDEIAREHRSLHPSLPYDDARDYYKLGHLAGSNPDYQGRRFEEIEPELERTWSGHVEAHHGPWGDVRDYVAEGFRHND
jgi:hypothetical protein